GFATLFLAVQPAGASITADGNGCLTTVMETPHILVGAGGVIAKSTSQCSLVPSTLHFTSPDGFFLWVCPTDPPHDEGWLATHCTNKGITNTNISVTKANTGYTNYVPATGLPGAHGTGYWIACSMWYSTGPNGTGTGRLYFSASKYIN